MLKLSSLHMKDEVICCIKTTCEFYTINHGSLAPFFPRASLLYLITLKPTLVHVQLIHLTPHPTCSYTQHSELS